jgi:Heterokaryon incompatibility protein (HET)
MRGHRRVQFEGAASAVPQIPAEGGSSVRVVVLANMEYSALDTDANEIRLLTLLPCVENDQVCCTLKHVSLINPPEYVALSYYWGDQSVTKEITINGVQVQITTNLESACVTCFLMINVSG